LESIKNEVSCMRITRIYSQRPIKKVNLKKIQAIIESASQVLNLLYLDYESIRI
jgi:hypothetical protein